MYLSEDDWSGQGESENDPAAHSDDFVADDSDRDALGEASDDDLDKAEARLKEKRRQRKRLRRKRRPRPRHE